MKHKVSRSVSICLLCIKQNEFVSYLIFINRAEIWRNAVKMIIESSVKLQKKSLQ